MAKQFVWDPSFWMKKAEKAIDAGRKTVTDIAYEVRAIRDRDPAARSDAEVLLLYPGLHAVLAHRAAHYLHGKKHFFAARAISQVARGLTGIEIHPGAKIGKGVFIDHGCAVVIGETAEVGDNCTIYQGVTLGGTGKHCGKRHPTLGSDVMVGAGAKVLGPFTVGSGSKIGALAVVLKEVPPNCTVVGNPGRVVRREGAAPHVDLDHVHLPDPIKEHIVALERRVSELEEQMHNHYGTTVPKEDIEDDADL